MPTKVIHKRANNKEQYQEGQPKPSQKFNKPWSSYLPPFGIIEKRMTRAKKENMVFAIITTGVMEKNNLQNTQGGMKDIDHASHKNK